MGEWAPGTTVAMVTHDGERHMALRDQYGWHVAGPHKHNTFNVWTRDDERGGVTDVSPLVCLELTREDADLLDRALRHHLPITVRRAGEDDAPGPSVRTLVKRLRDAIREQTPAPLVISENLGAVVEDYCEGRWVCDKPGEEYAWLGPYGARAKSGAIRVVRVLSEGVTP